MKNKINYIIMSLTGLFMILCLDGSNVNATITGSLYVEQLGSGINVGNIFETGLEDMVLDDSSITTMIDNLRGQGFSSIRIPVTWQGHWDDVSKVIDTEYLNKIKRFVDIAISKNMKVIITMYDDSWRWISNTSNIKETLALYRSLWTQIATYFANYNQALCFEAANAPFFRGMQSKNQLGLLDKYNESFVKSVRDVGGKNKERFLLLPLLNGQVDEENCKSMVSFVNELKDSNVIVSTQYYGLWDFSVNAAGTTTFNQDANRHMTNFFSCIRTYFTNNKIPVLCGEYGLYGYPTYEDAIARGQRLQYFNEFVSKAYAAKLTIFLWDTGVLYNRTTDQWIDEDLAYIIKNYEQNDYSYASLDAVSLVEGKETKDVTLTVSCNNAKLSYLRYNKKVLSLQTEYAINGNKVTITKSFLDSLSSAEYGLVGTIELVFTQGPSWKINVFKVGQPSFIKDGSREEIFSIPMKEQGDTVIAMEAFTKDKKPAGPLDWTTYQEYGYSFLPNYKKHCLTLTKEFIDSLPMEQEIILYVHFQSGQKLEYPIIKEEEGIREVTYDLSKKVEDASDVDINTDLQSLVEEENHAAIEKDKEEAKKIYLKKETDTKWNTVGWKLLFFSFVIMIILGFAIIYIYQAHRKENLENRLEETKDQLDEEIHKILIDKMGYGA